MEAQEIGGHLGRLMSSDTFALMEALIRRLASSGPVPPEEAARILGCAAEEVEGRLRSLPARVERDEAGRIVGAGLTLVPTDHRFILEGRTLYVWCALDALMFPVVLGRGARVESRCPATGSPIRLVVGPDGVSDIDPPGAAVTLVVPEGESDLRASFCVKVNFYASADAAREATPPGTPVVSVEEAYAVGRFLAGRLRGEGRAAPTSCCGE